MDTESIEKFLREARTANGQSPLQDAQVNAVIDRIWASQRYPEDGGPHANPDYDPAAYADYGFSIFPAQGDLIYLLCRAIRATRVVEFATSVGFSTLYFAAAMLRQRRGHGDWFRTGSFKGGDRKTKYRRSGIEPLCGYSRG